MKIKNNPFLSLKIFFYFNVFNYWWQWRITNSNNQSSTLGFILPFIFILLLKITERATLHRSNSQETWNALT